MLEAISYIGAGRVACRSFGLSKARRGSISAAIYDRGAT